jgi:hypothetical protein
MAVLDRKKLGNYCENAVKWRELTRLQKLFCAEATKHGKVLAVSA